MLKLINDYNYKNDLRSPSNLVIFADLVEGKMTPETKPNIGGSCEISLEQIHILFVST